MITRVASRSPTQAAFFFRGQSVTRSADNDQVFVLRDCQMPCIETRVREEHFIQEFLRCHIHIGHAWHIRAQKITPSVCDGQHLPIFGERAVMGSCSESWAFPKDLSRFPV